MTEKTLAITGGTGFVGAMLIRFAVAEGWHVRALTRRKQPDTPGVTWIDGALDQPEALQSLAKGSDAVIHVAGVVNAPDRAGFEAGNVAGTLNMVAAAKAAGVERFIHVSSLAARHPDLSNYGWSKAKAEAIVAASGLNWTILRPTGVYGPGDTEMLDLFRMAKWGYVLMSPIKRLSVIEVTDLCRALLAVVPYADSLAQIYELDDGKENGWSADSFGKAIGWAVDKPVTTITLPKFALHLAARIDRVVRRKNAKLTTDRANYLCHHDWTADPAMFPPSDLWQPQVSTRSGLKTTAQAYRKAGWI